MKIAVIGAGISGLGAAWALQRQHDVTLFEARPRLGGHANTVDAEIAGRTVPVDTGFIVYNEVTYPHFTRLMAALDVPTHDSDMSFSLVREGVLEYAGSLRGVLAQPSALLRSRYRRMLGDIIRFRGDGARLLETAGDRSIGELLAANGYSDGFRDDYLLPMTGAIWSAGSQEIGRYPAQAMLRFLANHGLIEISGRPTWRTVTGGSRSYVDAITKALRGPVHVGRPITGIRRGNDSVVVAAGADESTFDQVVLAVHADQAIRMLGSEATDAERAGLAAIPYTPNIAVLHSDPALMPARRAVWSSWNTFVPSSGEADHASVTYWMNRLQGIDERLPLFVSLNPFREPDPTLVHGRFEYSHPAYGPRSVDAQNAVAALQGDRRTWYAGAWMGYGFHEDGLQSGLNVAAALGSPAPWHDDVVPVSSAPPASRSVFAA